MEKSLGGSIPPLSTIFTAVIGSVGMTLPCHGSRPSSILGITAKFLLRFRLTVRRGTVNAYDEGSNPLASANSIRSCNRESNADG